MILAARSKSRMPSSGPRSQCGFGFEIESAGFAEAAHFDVVVRAPALPARTRAACSGSRRAARGTLVERLYLLVETRRSARRSRGPRPAARWCPARLAQLRDLLAGVVASRLQLLGLGERRRGARRRAPGTASRSRWKPRDREPGGDRVQIGTEELIDRASMTSAVRSEPRAGRPACPCTRRGDGSGDCLRTARGCARSSRTCG